MATLISTADGNLTGSSTFAVAEVGAGALNLVRFSTVTVAAAATSTSTSCTVTSGKVIDGILLWIKQTGASTGTLKVDLQKGGASQASVTVNKADLPDSTVVSLNGGPVLFKLTAAATGDGGSNWTIVLTTTGTGANLKLKYSTSGSALSFTRALRTTTTQAPAAADDLYVVGELTGAGTHNSRTVTMDSTAATAYGNGSLNSTTVAGGGIHISNYGTLSYGTTASTAYVLRVNGDLNVYQFGTLNIGATGSEIPRTSTAVLEFQPVSADGDFGLRCLDNSVVNIAGLSRTSGKAVVKCKLTADVVSSNIINAAFAGSAGNTVANTTLEASGNSLLATSFVESSTSAIHFVSSTTATSVTNVVFTVWLARGSGTHNRYVRVGVGNNSSMSTGGFYSDIDLQAGTAGTATATGTGTATSVSITPLGSGYLVRLIGKVSTTAATVVPVMWACSVAGSTAAYLGDGTQCFIFDHANLVPASSLSDTAFNVDADTGWLSGDAVCVASTTRTAAECEIYPLSANAGSSSFTSALYPFGGSTVSTHSGTTPTQAEIGLLTRNVKIRSTSNTLMSYVYCTALSTVTASWAEFVYLGANTANKRGIEIDGGAVCNPKSFTYCSLHDLDNFGLYCNVSSVTSLNLTFSNNVGWLNYAGVFVGITGTITNTDWTFDSNLIMRTSTSGISMLDVGGVCTNNTVVGANTNNGFILNESAGTLVTLGTFNGNTAHSGATGLFCSTTAGYFGTINNFTAWRNNAAGIQYSMGSSSDLSWVNLTLFANGTANFVVTTGDAVNISGGTIAADAAFPVTNGISISPNNAIQLRLSSVDMSGTGSIFAPHTTNDFFLNSGTAESNIRGVTNNCKFGAPNLFTTKTQWSPSANIGFEKYNQTAGDHRTEMTFGQLRTDSTNYHTAAPSMKMTPNSAGNKLESAPQGRGMLVAVASGGTTTVGVWIRKDTTYTGAQPRLIVRANPAIGINADTVLATYTAGTGSWNQITGTTATTTDAGAVELIVDCDGTAGFISVDDWTAT